MVQFSAPMPPAYPYQAYAAQRQNPAPQSPAWEQRWGSGASGLNPPVYADTFHTIRPGLPMGQTPLKPSDALLLEALLNSQSHGINMPALATFAQHYAAAHNKHSNMVQLTPSKGAQVGSVALGALGLMLNGFCGLLSGGVVGAGAGALIISLLRKKHPERESTSWPQPHPRHRH